MKIIHTADIHLGSKMDSRFPKSISDERKKELRSTFKRLVDYAKQNGVRVVMLCGDVFDTDSPYKKDKDFFYSAVRGNPDIDFLYLKGNHDTEDNIPEDKPENLKTFSENWTYYTYGNVVICGTEISGGNALSYPSSLNLDDKNLNIVMLHGQISDGAGGDINLKKLKNKHIDYLALGHIHKPSAGKLDERGEYVYSGCLEGRGFDETGEHGFMLLDADGGKISRRFIPFAERLINEISVDVSGCSDSYTAYTRVVDSVKFNRRDLYRINLTGDVNFDAPRLAADVEKHLADACYFVSVKDKTSRKIDISQYLGDLSVRGEFIRCVYADTSLSEEDKLAIIDCGLRALDGKEIEL